MHGNRILSPNPKFISSVIKQSEYFHEEILEKVNNKYYTTTELMKKHKITKPLHALKYIVSVLSPLRTL